MRIVTWNMGCGPRSRYRRTHDEAWDYLFNELNPDVAFVQEALVSKINEARQDRTVTLCELASEDVKAGTAVIVRGYETSPTSRFVAGLQTYIAPVAVSTPAGTLMVVAVHVYPGKQLHADLAKLVETVTPTPDDVPVLVGGDFNAARHIDVVYRIKKHRAFFDAMDAAGMHDVHFGLHGKEVQSFWGHQAKEKYQDDHFFLSKAWVSRVTSCKVIDNEVVRRLSDHGPVVLELDVGGAS